MHYFNLQRALFPKLCSIAIFLFIVSNIILYCNAKGRSQQKGNTRRNNGAPSRQFQRNFKQTQKYIPNQPAQQRNDKRGSYSMRMTRKEKAQVIVKEQVTTEVLSRKARRMLKKKQLAETDSHENGVSPIVDEKVHSSGESNVSLTESLKKKLSTGALRKKISPNKEKLSDLQKEVPNDRTSSKEKKVTESSGDNQPKQGDIMERAADMTKSLRGKKSTAQQTSQPASTGRTEPSLDNKAHPASTKLSSPISPKDTNDSASDSPTPTNSNISEVSNIPKAQPDSGTSLPEPLSRKGADNSDSNSHTAAKPNVLEVSTVPKIQLDSESPGKDKTQDTVKKEVTTKTLSRKAKRNLKKKQLAETGLSENEKKNSLGEEVRSSAESNVILTVSLKTKLSKGAPREKISANKEEPSNLPKEETKDEVQSSNKRDKKIARIEKIGEESRDDDQPKQAAIIEKQADIMKPLREKKSNQPEITQPASSEPCLDNKAHPASTKLFSPIIQDANNSDSAKSNVSEVFTIPESKPDSGSQTTPGSQSPQPPENPEPLTPKNTNDLASNSPTSTNSNTLELSKSPRAQHDSRNQTKPASPEHNKPLPPKGANASVAKSSAKPNTSEVPTIPETQLDSESPGKDKAQDTFKEEVTTEILSRKARRKLKKKILAETGSPKNEALPVVTESRNNGQPKKSLRGNKSTDQKITQPAITGRTEPSLDNKIPLLSTKLPSPTTSKNANDSVSNSPTSANSNMAEVPNIPNTQPDSGNLVPEARPPPPEHHESLSRRDANNSDSRTSAKSKVSTIPEVQPGSGSQTKPRATPLSPEHHEPLPPKGPNESDSNLPTSTNSNMSKASNTSEAQHGSGSQTKPGALPLLSKHNEPLPPKGANASVAKSSAKPNTSEVPTIPETQLDSESPGKDKAQDTIKEEVTTEILSKKARRKLKKKILAETGSPKNEALSVVTKPRDNGQPKKSLRGKKSKDQQITQSASTGKITATKFPLPTPPKDTNDSGYNSPSSPNSKILKTSQLHLDSGSQSKPGASPLPPEDHEPLTSKGANDSDPNSSTTTKSNISEVVSMIPEAQPDSGSPATPVVPPPPAPPVLPFPSPPGPPPPPPPGPPPLLTLPVGVPAWKKALNAKMASKKNSQGLASPLSSTLPQKAGSLRGNLMEELKEAVKRRKEGSSTSEEEIPPSSDDAQLIVTRDSDSNTPPSAKANKLELDRTPEAKPDPGKPATPGAPPPPPPLPPPLPPTMHLRPPGKTLNANPVSRSRSLSSLQPQKTGGQDDFLEELKKRVAGHAQSSPDVTSSRSQAPSLEKDQDQSAMPSAPKPLSGVKPMERAASLPEGFNAELMKAIRLRAPKDSQTTLSLPPIPRKETKNEFIPNPGEKLSGRSASIPQLKGSRQGDLNKELHAAFALRAQKSPTVTRSSSAPPSSGVNHVLKTTSNTNSQFGANVKPAKLQQRSSKTPVKPQVDKFLKAGLDARRKNMGENSTDEESWESEEKSETEKKKDALVEVTTENKKTPQETFILAKKVNDMSIRNPAGKPGEKAASLPQDLLEQQSATERVDENPGHTASSSAPTTFENKKGNPAILKRISSEPSLIPKKDSKEKLGYPLRHSQSSGNVQRGSTNQHRIAVELRKGTLAPNDGIVKPLQENSRSTVSSPANGAFTFKLKPVQIRAKKFDEDVPQINKGIDDVSAQPASVPPPARKMDVGNSSSTVSGITIPSTILSAVVQKDKSSGTESPTVQPTAFAAKKDLDARDSIFLPNAKHIPTSKNPKTEEVKRAVHQSSPPEKLIEKTTSLPEEPSEQIEKAPESHSQKQASETAPTASSPPIIPPEKEYDAMAHKRTVSAPSPISREKLNHSPSTLENKKDTPTLKQISPELSQNPNKNYKEISGHPLRQGQSLDNLQRGSVNQRIAAFEHLGSSVVPTANGRFKINLKPVSKTERAKKFDEDVAQINKGIDDASAKPASVPPPARKMDVVNSGKTVPGDIVPLKVQPILVQKDTSSDIESPKVQPTASADKQDLDKHGSKPIPNAQPVPLGQNFKTEKVLKQTVSKSHLLEKPIERTTSNRGSTVSGGNAPAKVKSVPKWIMKNGVWSQYQPAADIVKTDVGTGDSETKTANPSVQAGPSGLDQELEAKEKQRKQKSLSKANSPILPAMLDSFRKKFSDKRTASDCSDNKSDSEWT